MKKFHTACAIAALGLFLSFAQAEASENNSCYECNNHQVPEPSTIVLLSAGVAALAARKLIKKSND